MSEVPVTIHCQVYPKDKSVKPYPAVIVGFASITGLEVGGGPILPPDEAPQPEPPLVIWGGGGVGDYIDAGLPEPPTPPEKPPSAPEKPHEGWNWSHAKGGWYYLYVPGPGEVGPKRR